LALFIPEIEQNLRIDFGQSENRRTVDFRTGDTGTNLRTRFDATRPTEYRNPTSYSGNAN
jgi:hypothetical protein